jgi:ABC-type multidrug transport system ATPase subunit
MIAEISFGKIVLLATHVVTDVEYIGKEIILLKNGSVIRQDTPQSIIKDLTGKTYELHVQPSQVKCIEREFLVSNITSNAENVSVRIVSDLAPEGYRSTKVTPTLEEVYLHAFEEGVK